MARSKPRSGEPDSGAAAPEPDDEPEARERALLSPAARRAFVAATGGLGLALGWAALRLPWRPDAPLAVLLWVLAAANLGTGVASLGARRHMRRALGALVVLSLAAAPVFLGALVITSVTMVRMFGALGWGLTVALAAMGWLLALATLPLGVIGLRLLRRRAPDGHHAEA
ncbi:MAG TPA: hypothetical protein VMG12_19605 [Polyangiaceae bacterium]|nr:hypothetical protein [Polyangiaceae bacterium]